MQRILAPYFLKKKIQIMMAGLCTLPLHPCHSLPHMSFEHAGTVVCQGLCTCFALALGSVLAA